MGHVQEARTHVSRIVHSSNTHVFVSSPMLSFHASDGSMSQVLLCEFAFLGETGSFEVVPTSTFEAFGPQQSPQKQTAKINQNNSGVGCNTFHPAVFEDFQDPSTPTIPPEEKQPKSIKITQELGVIPFTQRYSRFCRVFLDPPRHPPSKLGITLRVKLSHDTLATSPWSCQTVCLAQLSR